MAIFYMNAQIIGRSAGRTATGAAAYRAGERIVDERTGQVFDYTRRRGERESAIYAPAGSPSWVQDRAQLWNAAEKAERRADAQVAREIVVAFPKELGKEQQRELIASYVQEQFVTRGMVADVAIHHNPGNPHAHIMLTMREMGSEGLASKKNREWNKPEMLEKWREGWATHANRALERAGREERIDHRSLAEQGSERLPQVHLGPHAVALERRGISTEKGDQNRLVAEHNAVVLDLAKAREERKDLQIQQEVSKRHVARQDRGWSFEHSKALAQLEYYNCGGRALSRDAVDDLYDESKVRLRETQAETSAIQKEGERLKQAEQALAERDKAAAEVKRLENPISAAKRIFSSKAREEYAGARGRLQVAGEKVSVLGTISDSHLQQQRAKWERSRSRLPSLEEKAAFLTKTIDRAATALKGFRLEHEREHEWIYRHRRQKSRDQDRGR
ncbi:MAG: MobQ family relaxase [Bacillota bacterium]